MIKSNQIGEIIKVILELDKLKNVTRKVKPLNSDRYENSAEHSWHLALFAMSSVEYINEVDIVKVIKMILVHDIGEIDTGDTMAFVLDGWEERKKEELESIHRIFGSLPKNTYDEFISLWKEFEEGTSKESLFANALDRAIPVILNLNNNGQSWLENNIRYEQVISRVKAPINNGFPELWEYLQQKLEEAKDKNYFYE